MHSDKSAFEPNHTARCLASALNEQKSCALNLVRDSVVAVDPQGHITYLNNAAEQLLGWTSFDLVGRIARTTLFAESKDAFDAAWREVCEKGEWRGELTQQTKHGAACVVDSHWSAVADQHSAKIASVLMVSTESVDTKLTAASLAHEMRNPLAGIKGVADTLLQRRQLTRQEREWMEAVRHEVMKIDARLRELLDVSQPRAYNLQQCLLSDLINRVVLLATHQSRSLTKRQGREISVEFIDATTAPLIMTLDPARIEDAVLNLVLNAIESIDGNGRVTVSLYRSQTNGDGAAMIEVTDTGCGVPVEIRRRIFEPLFTTKSEGTGLGLAAVQKTAAAYHGRITFKTRIGHGSTFVLTLPIQSQPNLTETSK